MEFVPAARATIVGSGDAQAGGTAQIGAPCDTIHTAAFNKEVRFSDHGGA
jgi:hypothetical protein